MPGLLKKTLFCLASILSIASVVLLVTALVTQKWVTGKILCKTGADLVNASDPELVKFIGDIYYGMFQGGMRYKSGTHAKNKTEIWQSKAGTSSARLPRNAKQRALTRIKLTSTNESDDVEVDDRLEDFFASSGKESTVDARDQRATVSRQSKAGTSSARLPRNAKQSALSRIKLSSNDESNDVEVDDCLDDSIAIYGKESTVDARDQRATDSSCLHWLWQKVFCIRLLHHWLLQNRLYVFNTEGLTVSCDISTDEQLFMGQGDYQFEIYRKMREENK
ncbi:UNVERIFIED_CONTAM: hypothetical protein FKN15_064593 [Acipenser sinensis]